MGRWYVLLTHNFSKPQEHNILNVEVNVQRCSVVHTLEIVGDGVHRKMKLEIAFKDILKIQKKPKDFFKRTRTVIKKCQ